MKIIRIDDSAIAAGRKSFSHYAAAVVCGPAADIYELGLSRATGRGMIVGGILACIEYGVDREDAILNAVARSTRCKRSTVRTVLHELAGSNASLHLWSELNGRYETLSGRSLSLKVMMAA